MTRSTVARLYQLRSKIDDFTGRWQMCHVALEVPLGQFAVGGFGERHEAYITRLQQAP